MEMTKSWVQHIGDDQLVYGLPKHMVGAARLSSGSAPQRDAAGAETSPYWTVHPKSTACERCKAMAGIMFAQEPERPHPNCTCEIRQQEGVPDEQVDCSHLVEVALPGLGTTLLDRDFAQRVQAWRELNSNSGISLTFSEGFRTTERQGDMEKNPKAIIPAKAGTSLHEAGRAVDVRGTSKLDIQGLLSIVVENARSVGISWGGSFADAPHFYLEVPGGRNNRGTYIQRAQICARRKR